jgi:hypothetical protein
MASIPIVSDLLTTVGAFPGACADMPAGNRPLRREILQVATGVVDTVSQALHVAVMRCSRLIFLSVDVQQLGVEVIGASNFRDDFESQGIHAGLDKARAACQAVAKSMDLPISPCWQRQFRRLLKQIPANGYELEDDFRKYFGPLDKLSFPLRAKDVPGVVQHLTECRALFTADILSLWQVVRLASESLVAEMPPAPKAGRRSPRPHGAAIRSMVNLGSGNS